MVLWQGRSQQNGCRPTTANAAVSAGSVSLLATVCTRLAGLPRVRLLGLPLVLPELRQRASGAARPLLTSWPLAPPPCATFLPLQGMLGARLCRVLWPQWRTATPPGASCFCFHSASCAPHHGVAANTAKQQALIPVIVSVSLGVPPHASPAWWQGRAQR